MRINIDNSKVVSFTNRLEKMRKYGLPVVINQTLNDAAKDVKFNTMPKSAASNFTQRNKTFFSATSSYERSTGFNINAMKSVVGFKAKKDTQERGGTIGNRDFLALNTSRTSNSLSKNVKKNSRIGTIRNIDKLKAKKVTIREAFKTPVGEHVIIKGTLFLVTEHKKRGVELKPMYDYEKNRKVKVKSTNFMKRASNESGLKIDNFFIKNAKKRIKLK